MSSSVNAPSTCYKVAYNEMDHSQREYSVLCTDAINRIFQSSDSQKKRTLQYFYTAERRTLLLCSGKYTDTSDNHNRSCVLPNVNNSRNIVEKKRRTIITFVMYYHVLLNGN